MSFHQPIYNDLVSYQQYSSLDLCQPPSCGLPNQQDQKLSEAQCAMSTHSQSQNEMNLGHSNPFSQAGRSRAVSYHPPPPTTVTFGSLETEMVNPFAIHHDGRETVSDMFGAASYPPNNHQRHTSFPGSLPQMTDPNMGMYSLQHQYQQPDLNGNFQYYPNPVRTVEPASIFKNNVTEAPYPLTATGTPDTSARATPIDEQMYLSVRNAPQPVSVDGWPSAVSTAESLPAVQTLRIRQPSSGSLGNISENASPRSELDELAIAEGYTSSIPAEAGEPAEGERKKRTRTPQACEGCRKRKAKCGGGHPCERCKYKHLTCVFAELAPKKAPAVTHPRTVSAPKAAVLQPQQKKRRNSEHVRYSSAPIPMAKTALIQTQLVQSTDSTEKQNFLQLSLEGTAPPPPPQRNYWAPPSWSTYTPPNYGYTAPLDDAGLMALGFSSQQPYALPAEQERVPSFGPIATYVNGHYVYSDLPITTGAVGDSRTPSISNNSSPSYGEVSLLSPYDFNMIGQASNNDSYFPASNA